MRLFAVLFLLAATLVQGADRTRSVAAPAILISLDGFRWDYSELFPAESPTIRQLMREGSRARALIPVFPSNTFPNHYSIVTGLYPAHHGIINNDFFDPALDAVFRYNQPSAATDARWWGGEPIWATAIKQGRPAAASFWVGSEAEIAGIRPTLLRPYDFRVPFETRFEELTRWLKLPPAERPAFVALYLEEINNAGHRFGPTSPEVAAAIRLCDDRIARLLAWLQDQKIAANLVLVSDHGMTSTSLERVVVLEDHIARDSVRVDAEGSALALRPLHGDAAAIIRAFQDVPHVKACRTEDLPARFHLRGNDRIAPVWILPDEGWHVVSKATFERLKNNYRATGYLAGDHGYDPALPNMQGILVAHGPAFRAGVQHQAVENIHVYSLLCAALGLQPAANDGDDRLVRAWLRN